MISADFKALAKGSFLLALMGCLVEHSSAEIIPAGMRTTWAGRVGVQGGIPDSRAMTVYTTLPAGASVSTINNAIANCPMNQVVQLSQGTYNLTSPITFPSNKQRCVLRGEGMGKTTILFNGVLPGSNTGVIQMGNAVFWWCYGGSIVNWTGGYSDSTSNITVSSTSGITPGMIIELRQLCQLPVCNIQGQQNLCTWCDPGDTCPTLDNMAMAMFTTVVSTGNGTLTIWPPVFGTNWNSGASPVCVFNSSRSIIERCGVEDLSIISSNNTASSGAAHCSVMLGQTINSWVKNVASYYPNNYHVQTYTSMFSEVRGCTFVGARYQNGDYNYVYGIRFVYGSHNLAEDNIITQISAAYVPETSPMCVFAYNFTTNTYYRDGYMQGACHPHACYSGSQLFEGNHCNGLMGDSINGVSGSHSVALRNRFTGKEWYCTYQTNPVFLDTGNRWYSVVGNILGTPGYHNIYESTADTSIYSFSRYGTCDPLVATTTLRHGNYDVVNNGIVWNPTITIRGPSVTARRRPQRIPVRATSSREVTLHD